MRKSKVERVSEHSASRVRSGKRCTIEFGDLEGDAVLTTVDRSGRPTCAARVADGELMRLYKAIGAFLDPINGDPLG